ncbi:MAG: hypothetical protein EOP42_09190 [Sphingobacteriaceae bacterium]|nr:MAG: hypothetical protein EOP42_09190 [Sphingobacteriaceae bacterium]
MKKFIIQKSLISISLMLVLMGLFISSCKKDNNNEGGKGAPTIKNLRAITAAPNDSVLTKVGPGQVVVIQGSNLQTVNAIYFSGVQATFNSALVADDNVVITVPAVDFSKINADQKNKIRLVTNYGEVTFTLPLLPPPPIISGVSNDYTAAGQTLTISGQYLYLINDVTFPGGSKGTNLVTTSTGTSITVTVPTGVTTGSLTVNGQGGTAIYKPYNDKVTGIACNFDDVFTYQYYSGNLTNDATLYPGNNGNYVQLTVNNLSVNDYAWYNGGRSINLNPVQWVPVASLGDLVSNWALKFEINVKEPWKAGTIMIRRDESGGWGFLARYEPWKASTTGSFSTNGWITVTIPFTQFKLPSGGLNGTGASATTLKQLLDTEGDQLTSVGDKQGKRGVSFMLINDSGTTPVGKVDMAIDNIRFVKTN